MIQIEVRMFLAIRGARRGMVKTSSTNIIIEEILEDTGRRGSISPLVL